MEEKEMTMEEKVQGLTILQELLENLNKSIEEMAEKRALLAGLRVALGQFKAEENNEILVQFNQGIYVEAKMKATDKYLVGIGSNIVVEKTKEQTEEYIAAKIMEVEESIGQMQMQFNAIEEQLMQLYTGMQK
jgi:prefoldin alpha subunit